MVNLLISILLRGECCRGKIKSYKGFVWRYAEDIISPSGESQR